MAIESQDITALKSLLLRAWRERWSDVQWSIHCKRLIPNSNSNHGNYHVAELLLQQSLVGSTPNGFLLSYLKHAYSTQMVSYACTIHEMAKHDDMLKPYCIMRLLDMMKGFVPTICSKASYEDSITLSKALLELLRWLHSVMYKALAYLLENRESQIHIAIVESSSEVIQSLLSNNASRALLYIAKQDDTDLYPKIKDMERICVECLGRLTPAVLSAKLLYSHNTNIYSVTVLDEPLKSDRCLLETSKQNLNVSINVLLTQEAVLHPTGDIPTLAEQILVIERTQGLNRSRLYCEMFRTCLLGLIDAAGGQDEIKWAAFTFLKLPQVLVQIFKETTDTSDKVSKLEQGIELLMTYRPLLDLSDHKSNCDCFSFLLQELSSKYNLISEAQFKKFKQKRQAESQKIKVKLPEASPGGQQTAGLILRAEPTVQSILKTLDTDYSKNQDALLGVLCHMLSGKSFELILAAAAATGRLQSFAVKLIKFNEFAKQSQGEAGKVAQTRALLFDITFLMLCHIMQLYGTEIISSCVEARGSFFAQWTSHCLPEDGKYKSSHLMPPADPNKVEVLLGQFNPGGELKYSLTKWHEVCHNTPYSLQEVLIAWEHEAITADTVKGIMDNVKSRMCCLPIVATAWLCSYINIVEEENRKKPISMIQLLKKTIQADPSNQYYNERSHLMQIIMHLMIQGVLPVGSQQRSNPYTLPLNTPAYTVLIETFHEVSEKGCVNLKAIHMFETLLNVGGAKWFCEHLVREVLSCKHLEELDQGISLVYSLFHMDLEALTLSLLHHTVPSLLQVPASSPRLTSLMDPCGRALAKLCVMCLSVVNSLRNKKREPSLRKGKKRTRADFELTDLDSSSDDLRPNKLRKISDDDSLGLGSNSFNFGDLVGSNMNSDFDGPTFDTKDSLHKALVNLFQMFNRLLSHSSTNQKTGFIMSFVEECVKSGPQTARFILQFMPLSMVSSLIKVLPSEFSPQLLLAVCDLSTPAGRKVAAKVVCQNARYHIK